MDNVVQLPRPKQMRTASAQQLGFFVRVGRNDHREILEVLSAGEEGIFGLVIEAPYAEKQHKTLIAEARKRNIDVILDPKTQQMAFPGSYSSQLKALAWGGSKSHHTVADFDGEAGKAKVKALVDFARRTSVTHLFGPSHVIEDPNDAWLRRDIAAMKSTSDLLGKDLGLIHSLAIPIALLRDDARRAALIAAIAEVPCEAIWLKVENFGDDATGEKTVAYINACRDFHARGIPIIADYVGGLPGLGALALGAVSGMAHGVTINNSFKANSWRRPRQEGSGGGTERRVYLPNLDMLVSPLVAEKFFGSSQRIRGRHVCSNTHCCARGAADMLERPAKHALYQRAREIENLAAVPPAVKVQNYLDTVRSVSDAVALAASADKVDRDFKKKLQVKQKNLGHFRDSMAHLATVSKDASIAVPPLRRTGSDR